MKMKLGTIMYVNDTFRLTKDLGVAQRGSGGVAGKPLKKCQKMGFLAPFFQFLKLYKKPWHMWYFTLYCITGENFVQIRLDLGL